ncbi:hypothetical protein PDJAM_G00190640, partial [Pangasius djambal]|nr:hypothetical protein [Pangasius djambal]
TGRVLLQRQCEGRTEHRKLGLSVRTSSPAWSASTSTTERVSAACRDLRGPAALMPLAPPALPSLPPPSFPHGNDVEGGVNRLVVVGSTENVFK